MNRPARITLIVALILLFSGGVVYGWRTYSNRKKLAALKAKVAESMAKSQPGGPPQGRGREGFREVRDEVRSLPESYQREFYGSMRSMGMHREEKRLDEFLAMNKEQRRQYLDKEIAQSEKRRKEFEKRRAEREIQNTQAANTSGAAGGGNGGPGGNDSRSRGGPPGQGGGPPGGGRFGGGGLSARLDNTSPEFRAKMAEYRREMELRRQQMGLPPGRGPRR